MLEVIRSGLFDTLQDLGRKGVQQYGVPYSGAMDRYSAGLANTILNNPPEAALLEISLQGPKLKFHKDTVITITGADFNIELNDNPVRPFTKIRIQPNDLLSFGRLESGARAYLAVKHGFKTTVVLKSRSWCPSVTERIRLQKGDLIPYDGYFSKDQPTHAGIRYRRDHFVDPNIEVFRGPEFHLLSEHQKDLLFGKEFTIGSSSNRMASQLTEKLPNNLPEMITSLVLPGTVQLTPSGQLIILMRDGQVTGGYPRIVQLTEVAINRLAQKRFGQKIRFKGVVR